MELPTSVITSLAVSSEIWTDMLRHQMSIARRFRLAVCPLAMLERENVQLGVSREQGKLQGWGGTNVKIYIRLK